MRFYYRDKLIGHTGCKDNPTITPTASCTKSVVALAIFKLVEMKALDIDRPLSEILAGPPVFTLDHYKVITPRHLLTHTSGLPGNDDFMPPGKGRKITGDAQFLNHLAPLYDRNVRAAMHPPIYQVGKRFDYSNPGTQILGAVASRALASVGDPLTLSEFVKQELLAPLGMTNTVLSNDEDGNAICNGGMTSTALDMVQLGRLIANEGRVNDRSILTPSLMREMLSTPWSIPEAKDGYGHLWWKLPHVKGFMAVGDFANLVLVLPEHNIIVSRTQPGPPLPPEYQESIRSGRSTKLTPFALRVAPAEERRFWDGFRKSIKTFAEASPPTQRHPLSDVFEPRPSAS